MQETKLNSRRLVFYLASSNFMPQSSSTPELSKRSSRSTSPTPFQRLGNIEFINSLLFNRERVYQSLRRLSPIKTTMIEENNTLPHDQSLEDQDWKPIIPSIRYQGEEKHITRDKLMPSNPESTRMAVTRSKGRPVKKTPAKTKPKGGLGLTVTRKRSPPATKAERASKTQKTMPKANTGKRVNGRGASVTDAFVISDDDDDNDESFQTRTESLAPSDQPCKIDSPDSESDVNPALTYNNPANELARRKAAHSTELEQLRQQLTASEAKAKQIREDAEREAHELHQQQSIAHDRQMADVKEMLEAEQTRSSDLSWECDHLRREMEAARSRLESESNTIKERDEYKTLYQTAQATTAHLTRTLAAQAHTSTQTTTALTTQIQDLKSQIHALQHEITQLSSTSSPSSSQLSSIPSTPSTPTPDQKLANVRKTYIIVKRRYDHLHAIAQNISTTTLAWDYGGFGEFGKYLRQLKGALEEGRG